MTRRVLAVSALILLAVAYGPRATAMGEEEFGNKPLSGANYTDWPGIMPVINDTHRAYRYWVNGNEQFFYKGDTDALNSALVELAKADTLRCEVVLRPGPGMTHPFDGKQDIPFSWDLHIVGGIARHMTKEDRGDRVWSKHPVLSVYVGGAIDLAKLVLPKGLTVSTLGDVKARTCDGFKSSAQDVRGWTCGVLADLDRYDPASAAAMAKLLDDPVDWVKLNAVTSLQSMGATAKPYLAQIRALSASTDKSLSAAAKVAGDAIAKAGSNAPAASQFASTLKRIDRYLAASRSGR